MKAEIEERVRKHGEQLQSLFPATRGSDPVNLCRKLRRLETEAHNIALKACNTGDDTDAEEAVTLAKIDKVLDFTGAKVPVFINLDARGYALKIDSDWMREHREVRLYEDWGSFGIIAPDLREA
jgi:hypothetical protein